MALSRRFTLLSELALFMIGVPLLLRYALPPKAILPVVWAMALFCSHVANKVEKRRFREYWHYTGVTREELIIVGVRFVICAVLLSFLTVVLQPQILFSLWRERGPGL